MALTMLLVTCGVSFTGFGGAAQMGMMALGGGDGGGLRPPSPMACFPNLV